MCANKPNIFTVQLKKLDYSAVPLVQMPQHTVHMYNVKETSEKRSKRYNSDREAIGGEVSIE